MSDDEEEFSLEDLGAAYARAAAEHDPESFSVAPPSASNSAESEEEESGDAEEITGSNAEPKESADEKSVHSADESLPATPEAIVEGALFVGHPHNEPITLERLASLMRGVTIEEVQQIIDRLNESYQEADQGLRIVPDEHGFKMSIAPEVETVRRSFLGKVREARLSQAMIEVLSLVAYQPGISGQLIQDQRGRDSGPLLNQLVRRRLLELRREKSEDSKRPISCYYPSERFLMLFGLESLDDLPQVDDNFAG